MFSRFLGRAALLVAASLSFTAHAAVTPGGTFTDKAIVTQSAAVAQIADPGADGITGAALVHDFDNAVAADPSYELTSPSTIGLSSGRHLVMYSTRFDATGGQRAEIQSLIKLNGTALAAGRSQGFIRQAGGANEAVMSGGAIIDVALDDDVLTLESARTDNETAPTVTRVANFTSAQLLKLDDSWDYLSLERGVNQGGTVGTTAVDVTYDTNNSAGTMGTAFSFTATSGNITLNEGGLYLVFANTGINKANNATRTNFSQRLTLDGAEVLGSKTTTYVRGDADAADCNSGMAAIGMIVSATAGQVLNVDITMESGGSAGTIQGGSTALTMVKLPLTAKYIQVTDSTNQNVINSAATVVGFDTLSSPSNAALTHAGGSTVTATDAGDYLFFGSLFTQSDATNDNNDRITPITRWSVGGSPIDRGHGAAYNRDNGGNRIAGSWNSTLLELTAGQTVEMTSQNVGTAKAVADPIPTNTPVMQGLSIASLIVNNDPAIATNLPITVLPGSTGNIIDNSVLDTFDNDTPATGLTYTVDTAPTGGTLNKSGGALGMGGTFTQDDVDNNLITFDAGAVAMVGGFDFTVSDGSASDSSSFVINIEFPTVTVTIVDDGNVAEGSVTDFNLMADVAPAGADMTVTVAYSGSATDGTDFTGSTTVDILDGTTVASINITTLTDGLFEGAESVTATITDVSGATVSGAIGSPASATFLIEDGANSAPTGTNLAQVVAGVGTLPIADIVVTDPDTSFGSAVTAAGTPLFYTNGVANETVFTDGRANDDSSFDIDGAGPALSAPAGFSLDIAFIPQAADLTGVVDLWEIGGSSNGSVLLLVEGVPHILSKCNGNPAHLPIDDMSTPGVFTDLDWGSATDNQVVVPLATTPFVAGVPAQIALVFDITGNTVKSSVDGSLEATATLLNPSGNNWRGDHTVNTGTGAGSGTGGSSTPGGLALQSALKNMANGFSGTSSVRFWNNATGDATGTAGSLDQVTATLTISGWASAANGTLTAASGNGETFVAGVWSVTGDVAAVNAALAAVEFVTGGSTADPTVIAVALEDGDEDGGGPTTGTILVTAVAADPIYVDDDFAGSIGDPIADADGGPPVSPATFGLSAFTNLSDALGAVTPTGTIIVNDGDYSTENIALADMVTLQLTDTAGPVQIGDIAATTTNAIDLATNTLELGATNASGLGIDAVISGAGNLNKVGTGLLIIRGVNTYTGTNTITDGILRVGRVVAGIQGELVGDGPVVVNAPGRFEIVADLDKTISQTGAISGTGSVGTLGDGTLVFDGAGPNTFSGGFTLGDAGVSSFDGVDQGAKNGFVVVNHGGHLGTGLVHSRGSQLQAGTPGLVIPNDIDVDGGGFRCGGTIGFELSGTIAPINNALRGFGNYGLEGCDLIVSGTISMTAATHQVQFEGSNNRDNGSWLITGNVTGVSNLINQNTFDGGVVTLAGTNDYTGTTTTQTGTTTVLNGSHTGGGTHTVQANATLEGTGSTTSAVVVAGTVSPGGDAVGTLTTGDLTINGTLAADLDSLVSTDQIVANGAVTLGAASALAISAGAGLTAGDLILIDNDDAADPVTGTFAGLTEGMALDAGALGFDANITYLGGVGDTNDVGMEFDNFTIIGQWRLDNYGDPANAGAGDNTVVEPNGRTNLENFALGFDSDGTGDGGTLTFSAGGITALGGPQIWEDPADGKFYFQYTRRSDHVAAGLTIAEEFSRDLAAWEVDASAIATVVTTGTGDDSVPIDALQVELPGTLPVGGGKARNGRLNITIAP